MANIVKLGQRPKTFKEIQVEITLPNGDQGVIPVTFKYMTKAEFGAWQDRVIGDSKENVKEQQADTSEFSWELLYAQASEKNAEQLLILIDAWGLDVGLTKAAIMQLEEECGAAVIPSLFEAFGKACREGKLGN